MKLLFIYYCFPFLENSYHFLHVYSLYTDWLRYHWAATDKLFTSLMIQNEKHTYYCLLIKVTGQKNTSSIIIHQMKTCKNIKILFRQNFLPEVFWVDWAMKQFLSLRNFCRTFNLVTSSHFKKPPPWILCKGIKLCINDQLPNINGHTLFFLFEI